MLKLNDDCLMIILEYLNLQSVLNLSKCNKYLNWISRTRKKCLINSDVDKLCDIIRIHKDVYIEIGFYNFKTKTDIIRERLDSMRVLTYNGFPINRLINKCIDKYYKCVILNSNYYSNYLIIVLISKETYVSKGVNDGWDIDDYSRNFVYI